MAQYLNWYCDAPRQNGNEETRSADKIKTKNKQIVGYDEKRRKSSKTKQPRKSSRARKKKTAEPPLPENNSRK